MRVARLRRPYRTGADLLGELRDRNRVLFVVAALNAALAVLFAALMAVDGRTLLGRNVWTKPWKFATSIAVFSATMAWLLPSLSLGDRLERRVTYTIAAAMVIEISLISVQAARAVPSHFNLSTPLDGVVFGIMGAAITANTLVVAYVLWRVIRDPPELRPAYLRGLQLGLFVFVVASFEGWLMVAYGSHSVGAPAGAPGLPLLNWKLTGGDLRVAHFIGLHALQVLPFVGYLSARRTASTRRSLAVVAVAALLYGGFTVATFVQALLGHPFVPAGVALSGLTPPLSDVFAASFLTVAPVWALMVLAPTWRLTERVVGSPLVALPAALLYVALLAPQVGAVASGVLSPSLSGMAALFSTDAGATLAWVHFLAFDLLVGRWIYLDSRRRGTSPLVVSPILVGTLLFGPVGFVAYVIGRATSDNSTDSPTRKPI